MIMIKAIKAGCIYYNPAYACYMLAVQQPSADGKAMINGFLTSDLTWCILNHYSIKEAVDHWHNDLYYVEPVNDKVLLDMFMTLYATAKEQIGVLGKCNFNLAYNPHLASVCQQFKAQFDESAYGKSRKVKKSTSTQRLNACKRCHELVDKEMVRGVIEGERNRILSQTKQGVMTVYAYTGVPAVLVGSTGDCVQFSTQYDNVSIGYTKLENKPYYRYGLSDKIPGAPKLKQVMEMLDVEQLPYQYHRAVYKSTANNELILMEGLSTYTGSAYHIDKLNKIMRFVEKGGNGKNG